MTDLARSTHMARRDFVKQMERTSCFTSFASMWGAPEALCRITITSGFIASRFLAMSIRVSPLTTLLVVAEILTVSAPSRFPAISNDVLVRVLGSMNRLMMVLPRSVGTFLISRVDTSMKDSAVSRIRLISSTERSWIPRRSFLVSLMIGPQ